MKKRNHNHRAIMQDLIPNISGGYYCGGWTKNHQKFKLRCPYCQKESPKPNSFRSDDYKAALLQRNHNGYDHWCFHCLACHTSTPLDYLIADHPDLMKSAMPEVTVGISTAAEIKTSDRHEESGEYQGFRITKLPTVTPQSQAGQGGYLDSMVYRKKQKPKNWWDH